MLVRIPLTDLLTWQLVFDYDNSNNSAAIEHSIRIRESHSISMSNFHEGILHYASRRARSKGEAALDFKASYRVLSASFILARTLNSLKKFPPSCPRPEKKEMSIGSAYLKKSASVSQTLNSIEET
jgi:hypothetical protein